MAQIHVRNIRGFQPGVAIGVAQRIEGERRRVTRVIQLTLEARSAGTTWIGPAALMARTRQAALVAGLTDIATRLGVSATVVRELADRMAASRELLVRADHVAWDHGAWVDDDGKVHVPPHAPTGDSTTDAHRDRREVLMRIEVARCVTEALRVARATDVEAGRQLQSAAADRVSPAVTGDLAVVPPPPMGAAGDPAGAFANAAWWRSLTAVERAQVIRTHPEWVGPRDGIPAWERHAANLVLLARARNAAKAELERLGSRARRMDVVAWERVQSIAAIDAVLARSDGVTRHLLLIDSAGPVVRAVLTVGDVDRAGHVVTYVGGFSTSPHVDAQIYDDRFVRMKARAESKTREPGEQGEVAIALWMGYPAPQLRDGAFGDRSVLNRELALAWSDDLASFTNGIAASRDDRPHQTMWAHSYGSVVAGFALQQPMTINDVALFGSPGTTLDTLAEGGLKADSLNVLASPTDLVAASTWHGRDPRDVPLASSLSARCSLKPGTNELLLGSFFHGNYLDAGTTSEHNLTAIAAGRPEQRVPADASCPLPNTPLP